jgi:cytochrome c oxidase subunit 2
MNSEAANGMIPIQGTEIAAQWDAFYWFCLIVCAVFFFLVVGAMIVFAMKYRHQPGKRPTYIEGNHLIEFIWTVIPTIVVLVIFAWGWTVYRGMVSAPAGAYEVRVIGKQWAWDFQYEDGRVTSNQLFVPVNKPIKLRMSSTDVLHSFFVPNFRIKQDVVPGMYTNVWFEATVTGKHRIYCTEFCGLDHSGMIGEVVVLKEDDWKKWARGKSIQADYLGEDSIQAAQKKPSVEARSELSELAKKGKQLYEVKGCTACHSLDGSKKIGPSFKGIWGRKTAFSNAKNQNVDANYIRESLEYPKKKIVKGYPPVMMVYKGQFTEEDYNALIEFFKTLKK